MPDEEKTYSSNLEASGDWKPRPDPSVLTANAVKEATDLLRREMQALFDRMAERLAGVVALTETRLGAIEKSAAVFEDGLNRIPTALDVAITHLKELHDSRFDAVAAQLIERDVRYSLVSSDAKNAVADALAAQKEAVAKQDLATQKAIDQQSALSSTQFSAISAQQNDLKDRMTRAETANANAISAQSTKTTSVSQLISWGLLAVAAVALVLPIIERTTTAVAK